MKNRQTLNYGRAIPTEPQVRQPLKEAVAIEYTSYTIKSLANRTVFYTARL